MSDFLLRRESLLLKQLRIALDTGNGVEKARINLLAFYAKALAE